MNADDRAPAGPGQPAFAPVSGQPGRPGFPPQGGTAGAAPAARQASPFGAVGNRGGAPAAGSAPTAGAPSQPGASQAPGTSGPQRTAFRPQPGTTGQQPTGQQPTGAPGGAPSQAGATQAATSPATSAPQPVAPAGAPGQTGTQRQSAFAGLGGGAQVAPAASGTVPARTATGSVGLGKANAKGKAPEPGAPRKVRVLVSRLDPLSALKIGFLLAIAAGIMLVVAMHIIWTVVNAMGTFEMVNDWVDQLFDGQRALDLKQFMNYEKVMSATVLIAVFNTVVLSAMSVLGALIYNAVSRVVGGVYLTLTDD